MTLTLTSATGGGESAMAADLATTQQSLSLWRAGWDEDTRVIRRTRVTAVVGWTVAVCLGLGWWVL